MKIRKYKPLDRKDIERIHFETGFIGSSMSELLSNNKLWKKGISYYIEKEPENILILEDKDKIIGYLLGCLNDSKKKDTAKFIINNITNPIKSLFLKRKDRIFWNNQIRVLSEIILGISEEKKFKTPKNSGHVHINLLSEARGKGYGTLLLKEYEKNASAKGIRTIHADSFLTEKNSNSKFWEKNGYKIYSKVRTTMWKKYLPQETVYLVCYYKRLK